MLDHPPHFHTLLVNCRFVTFSWEHLVPKSELKPEFAILQAVEAEGVELYDPFIRMLQFGLEPLVLAGDGAQPGAHLPVAATILRAVKRAQDASPEPRTEHMCVQHSQARLHVHVRHLESMGQLRYLLPVPVLSSPEAL